MAQTAAESAPGADCKINLKGTGGNEPAFIRDQDGGPLRMFVRTAPG